MIAEQRRVRDLVSVGPKIVHDLKMLGVRGVPYLALQDPDRLYEKLCRLTGKRQDPCVLDVFRAAIAQARDPRLPAEQCQWWYWSRKRKAGGRR
ncbi:MAG TPA: helix-hairpin-helix domain-containing protein [Bryobacteraceae bacterium]|nr:helix-hairpin-helix domain-containing protein [Bryobacteraceae bacterium]